MATFTGEFVTICTIGITLFAIAIYIIINKIKNSKATVKNDNNINTNLPIGYFLCCANTISFLIALYICNI